MTRVRIVDPVTKLVCDPVVVASQREFAAALGAVAHRAYAMPRELGWMVDGDEPAWMRRYRNPRFMWVEPNAFLWLEASCPPVVEA